MNYLKLFIVITSITLIGCDKEDQPSLNCDKLTSREQAQNLLNHVNEDRFKDSSRIVANLIGEWGLIGVVPGWFGFETGQECIKLTIGSDRIKLEDLNSGNNKSSEWKLKVFEVNGSIGFHLETDEDVWNNRMGMQIFSESIMWGSGRVDDGDTYIYEKIK